jgi:hypothetical protein
MEELQLVTDKTFRYPAPYRAMALFGVLLFGLIALASVMVAAGLIGTDPGGALLLGIGCIGGVWLMLWGLDFATRSITTTPDGLSVRWLHRRSLVPWSDVLGWRYRVLSLIHIRVRKGAGIFVWPLLENYTDLLNDIDAHRRDQLRDEVLTA